MTLENLEKSIDMSCSSFFPTGELKQWCLDDDCYRKLYPSIANNTLLENLIDFVENESNHPTQSGIDHSRIYRKQNGRKIDSSRNYKLVREDDDHEVFHLYVEITKGPDRGKLILVDFSLYIGNERLLPKQTRLVKNACKRVESPFS